MSLQHFLKLDKEKQQVILDAALDEFLECGYDMASTNRIVEKAGIAKGTLFKYFSNKEELFIYVVEHCFNLIADSLSELDREIPEDFFENLMFQGLRKYRLQQEHPREFGIFLMLRKNPDNPVYSKIYKQVLEKSQEYFWRMTPQLSAKNLRPGVSPEKALLLIDWVIFGREEYYREHPEKDITRDGDFENYFQKSLSEFNWIFDLLKYGLYAQPHTQKQ